MKAALLHAPREDLRILQVPDPECPL